MVQVGGLWLVDGRAGDEGALIASAAWADHGARAIWVTRASQWLSTSDFMGRGYRLTAADPAAARAVLARLGVKGVVSIAEHDRYAYPQPAPPEQRWRGHCHELEGNSWADWLWLQRHGLGAGRSTDRPHVVHG